MNLYEEIEKLEHGRWVDRKIDVLELIEKLRLELKARSGWEMLPARNFACNYDRNMYHYGIREMEEVWHKIIDQLLKKPEEVKP